jgi:capsular exopolysaccharide synthesis family protein
MHGNLQLLPPAGPNTTGTRPPSTGPEADGNEVAQLLRSLWRQRGLICLVMLLGAIAVATVVLRLPPSYRAEAVLLFAPAAAGADPTTSAAPAERPGDLRHLASEIERIRARGLLTRVVREAGLLYDPAFNPVLGRTPGPLERLGLRAPPPPETLRLSRQRAATLAVLRDRLTVQPVGRSRALSLRVRAADADSAARVANAVAEVYLADARERARRAREDATGWLDRRVEELRGRVQAAEAAVADFRIESGLADRGPDSTATRERVGGLNRALAHARAEAADAQARLRQVNARAPDAAPPVAAAVSRPGRGAGPNPGGPDPDGTHPGSAGRGGADPGGAGDAAGAPLTGMTTGKGLGRLLTSQLIEGLRRQEADLERNRAQLATRYGPRHPRLREANAELLDVRLLIDDEMARIAQGLRQEAALARERVNVLEGQLQQVNAETGALGRAQVKLAQLEREAAAERALFDTFLARLKATRVGAQSPGSRAELITRAHPPVHPSAPNRPLLAGFGVLAAAALAVALALLREALDRGVRGPEQLERLTGLRVLASVPRVRRDPAGRVLAQPAGALAEALRGLHTALLLADLDRAPRTVLVTSALPGEGKTALACALARVLARAGRRVLLIDADLRYPQVAATLRMPGTPGLSDLLTRQCSRDAALQRDPGAGLDGRLTVLPAGHAGDPGRLLDSDQLRHLIAELGAGYDLVLVDAPPVLAVADPRTLASWVDATVLAVRWARTPRARVRRAAALLRDAGADLAGAALVQVDPRLQAREASGAGGGFGRRRRYYAGA